MKSNATLLQSSLTWQPSSQQMETQVRLTTLFSEWIILMLSRGKLSRVVLCCKWRLVVCCFCSVVTEPKAYVYSVSCKQEVNPTTTKHRRQLENDSVGRTKTYYYYCYLRQTNIFFNSTSLSRHSVSLQARDEDGVTHSKNIREMGMNMQKKNTNTQLLLMIMLLDRVL